ncbi:hypothetical protein C0Q70_02355 [Pomacea canaliculata]|uniref:Uncharacterized protein n=1 Tax=Pomacea canaliculata TaxID=400727 RepID=A0A2T7PPN9_POMCA|nr:hypothetical protein C0Q70_02355 [Pomacea canaliculata]
MLTPCDESSRVVSSQAAQPSSTSRDMRREEKLGADVPLCGSLTLHPSQNRFSSLRLPGWRIPSAGGRPTEKVSVFCSPVCDIEVRTIISNSSDSDQVECIIPVAEDRVQLNLSCKVDVSESDDESDILSDSLEMTTVHSVERHTVGGVWMCRVRNPVSSENDFYKIAKCRIEVIHVPQPSDIVCDVKLRTTDWVVEGWCTVAKIYSFYKMYNCSWHRTNGAEWLIPSENISFSMKSYIDPQNKREYNSGNCSFKHSLTPFVDASYKYHAIIQPGEVLAEAQTLKIGLINLFPPTSPTALW